MQKKLVLLLFMCLVFVVMLSLTPIQTFADFPANNEPDISSSVLSTREANMVLEYPTLEMTLESIQDLAPGLIVDLVFVIDDSGSMSSYINNVKRNITEFVKGIQSSDIELRIGIVMFRDNNTSASRVLTVNGSVWHKSYADVIASLDKAVISGGAEPTLDALGFLTSPDSGAYDWNPQAIKHCVLITDEWMETTWNRHGYTSMNEVIDDAVNLGLSVSVVTIPSLYDEVRPLVERTGGSIANINDANFQGFFLGFLGDITSMQNPGTMGLQILYAKDKYLSDTEIRVNGEKVVTDSKGMIPFPMATGDIVIEAKGYHTYIFDAMSRSDLVKTIQLKADNKGYIKPYISSVHIKEGSFKASDLNLVETKISEGSDDTYNVTIYAVWQEHNVPGKVYWGQNESHRFVSTEGSRKEKTYTTEDGIKLKYSVITFNNIKVGKRFVGEKDVYAYCCGELQGGVKDWGLVEKDASDSYRTKIKITDEQPPEISASQFLLDEFLVSSPENTPIFGSEQFAISAGAYKVNISHKGSKYKVAIGGEIDKKFHQIDEKTGNPKQDKWFDSSEWTSFKFGVKQVKDGKSALEDFNGFVKKKNDVSFFNTFKFKAELVGYIEFEYVGKNIVVTDSGGYLKLTGAFGKPFYISAVPGLYIDVDFSLSTKAAGKWFRSVADNDLPLEFDFELSGEITLSVGACWGVKGFFSAGVGGEGKFVIIWKPIVKYRKMSIKGRVWVKATALFWSKEYTILPWNKDAYEFVIADGTYSSSTAGKAALERSELAQPDLPRDSLSPAESLYDISLYTPNTTAYSQVWLGGKNTIPSPLAQISQAEDFEILEHDSYEDNRVQLISLNNGQKMLLWLARDNTRGLANSTYLVYSLFDPLSGSWSVPMPVADDGTADYYPVAKTDGSKVYVAWQNQKTTYTDDVGEEIYISGGEIMAAVYANGSFGVPQTVTNNTTLDTMPDIAIEGTNVKLVWVNNTDNRFFETDGINAIQTSTLSGNVWSNPVTLKTGLKSINSLSAALKKGKLYVAYDCDMDNNYEDTSDMEIFQLVVDGSNVITNRLTNDDFMDSAPQYGVIDGEIQLLWYSENNLYVLRDLDSTTIKPLFDAPNGVNDCFSIAQPAMGTNYIVWPQVTGEHVSFFASLYNGEHWSAPILIGSKETKVLNPKAVVEADGNLWVAFNEVMQKQETDEFGFTYLADGKTNLCLLKSEQKVDLTVSDELLYVDNRDVVPGRYIPLDLLVKNNGFVAIEQVDVYVNDELYTTLSLKLPPGHQEALTVAYTLPDEIVYQTINIKVLPHGMPDSNPLDNSVSVSFGFAELGITEVKAEDIGTQKLLSITVENESFVPAGAFVVNIHEDTVEGAIIAQFPVESLKANGFVQFLHAIDISDVEYDENGLKKYVVEIVTTQEEYSTGNNTDVIAFTQENNEGIRAEVLRFSSQGNIANIYGAVYNNTLEALSFDLKIELLNLTGEVIGVSTQLISLDGKSHETFDETIIAASSEIIGSARVQLHPAKEISELYPIALNLDTAVSAVIDASAPYLAQIYRFDVPSSGDGLYQLRSIGFDSDAFAALYNENGILLAEDDDGGDEENFNLIYNLRGNTTYYYKIIAFANSASAGVNIKVQAPGKANIQLTRLADTSSHKVTYNYTANGGVSATKAGDTVQQSSNIDLTPTASKPGWTFLGWNTNASANSVLTSLKMEVDDITLYAIFKNDINVTFVDYSGANQTTRNIALSTSNGDSVTITMPPQNTITGWTTIGWTTDQDASADPLAIGGSIYSVSAGSTFYGLYQMPVTLTYSANSGTGPPPNETKYRRANSYSITEVSEATFTFTVGAAPTRANYLFLGWATRNNATAPEYQPGEEIELTASITLYALWQIRPSYTVSYNANGGTSQPGNQTKYQGQALTLSATKYTRFGYTFVGWSDDPEAVIATYLPGTSYNEDAAVTLYAIWQEATEIFPNETYAATMDFSGQHLYYTFMPSVTGIYAFVTSEQSALVYSYLFKGDTQLASSSSSSTFSLNYALTAGEIYYYRSNYSSASQVGSYKVRLTNVYTISYDANEGSGAPGNQTKLRDANLTLSTTLPTRPGYTFLGWSDNATAISATYTRGDIFKGNADTTLYAVWSDGTTYTIAYNANSGSGGPSNSSIKAQGIPLQLSLVQPTRTNYTFLGWGETRTSTAPSYQPGDTYTNDAAITLYAIWQILPSYSVTYNANGGASPPGVQTKYQGIDLTLSANLPTNVGYVFCGWSTDNNATTAIYFPGASYKNDAPVTLFAIWESAADLPLNTSSPVSIDFGRGYQLYRFIPDVTGDYTFTTSGQPATAYAYLQNSSGTTITSSNSSSTFNLTYGLIEGETYYFRSSFSSTSQTGSFQVKLTASSKITYDGNGIGVTGVPATQTKYFGETLRLQTSVPARFGYNFLGWSTDPLATSASYLPGADFSIDEVVTLYAVWEMPQTLSLNSTLAVNITRAGEQRYVKFTPKVSEIYRFVSSDSTTVNKYAYLFNAAGVQLAADTSYGAGGGNFAVYYALTAGETYYYRMQYASTSNTGSFNTVISTSYRVTYNANGSSVTNVPAVQNKLHDIDLTLSAAVPARLGYTFLGWSEQTEATIPDYLPGEIYFSNRQLNLYAIWDEAPVLELNTALDAEITITGQLRYFKFTPDATAKYRFYSLENGATNPYGELYNSTGTRLAYNNDFISGDSNFGIVYDLTEGQSYYLGVRMNNTADKGVFKVQVSRTYIIIYNANGGSGAPATQYQDADIPLILAKTAPTRFGFTFVGWNTDSSAVTAAVQPGSIYTANVDIVYYAVWQEASHIEKDIEVAVEMKYNKQSYFIFTPAETAPYRFFTTNAVEGTYVYVYNTSGGSYLARSSSTSGDSSVTYTMTAGTSYYLMTTLYDTSKQSEYSVKIIRNSYTITFDANGGSGGPVTQTKTTGTDLTLSTSRPTKGGYAFLGWSSDPDATTPQYVSGGKYTADESIMLYAVWTDITTYVITFNANNGSNAPPAQTKVQGINLILTSEIPSRANYNFLGWATTRNATEAAYQPGSDFDLDAVTTLYAVWQALTSYTVVYNANGGASAPASQSKYEDIPLTLTSNKPVLFGRDFIGWAETQAASAPDYLPNDIFMKNENITLYALWGSAPPAISLNIIYPVDIGEGGMFAYFRFTPASTGFYSFTSSDNTEDPVAELYSQDGARLAFDDDNGNGNNFRLEAMLTADVEYVFKVFLHDTGATGSFRVRLTSVGTSELRITMEEKGLFKVVGEDGNILTNTIALDRGRRSFLLATVDNTDLPSGLAYDWKFLGSSGEGRVTMGNSKGIYINAPTVAGKYTLEIKFSSHNGTLSEDSLLINGCIVDKITCTVYVTYGDVIPSENTEKVLLNGFNIYWLESAFGSSPGTIEEALASLNKRLFNKIGKVYAPNTESNGSRDFDIDILATNLLVNGGGNSDHFEASFNFLGKMLGITGLSVKSGVQCLTEVQEEQGEANNAILYPDGKVVPVYVFGNANYDSPSHTYTVYSADNRVTSYDSSSGKSGPGEYGAIYSITQKVLGNKENAVGDIYKMMKPDRNDVDGKLIDNGEYLKFAGAFLPNDERDYSYAQVYQLKYVEDGGEGNKDEYSQYCEPEKKERINRTPNPKYSFNAWSTEDFSATYYFGDPIILTGNITLLAMYSELNSSVNYIYAVSQGVSETVNLKKSGLAVANDEFLHISSSGQEYAKDPISSYDSFVITISPNDATDLRIGTVTVVGEDYSETIYVIQDGSNESITLSREMVVIDLSGSEEYISVKSNVYWEVSSNAEWLKVHSSSGYGDDYFLFSVEASDSGEAKTAFITVRGGGVSKIISVTQKEAVGFNITGMIRSYYPDHETTIRLMSGGEPIYTTTIPIMSGYGLHNQEFVFEGVEPGVYDLVITKAAHTSFTVRAVVVNDKDVDLTKDSRPEVQLMTLRCGDINGDGLINDADLTILWRAGNYNKKAGEADNPLCDLNGDGLINDADLTILWLAYNYNRGPVIIMN